MQCTDGRATLRKTKCFESMINLVVDLVSVKFDIFKIKSSYELAISFHLLNTSQFHHLFSVSRLLTARVTASPKGTVASIIKRLKTFDCHLLGEKRHINYVHILTMSKMRTALPRHGVLELRTAAQEFPA